MKLTLKHTTLSGSVRIEDEIYLEDDAPMMVQYTMPDMEQERTESFNLPPDTPDGFIRSVVSSNIQMRFPFIEVLCRQIFTSEE